MKLRHLGLVVAVASAVFLGTEVRADSVDGSQGFSVGSLSTYSGSLNQSITFSNVASNGGQSGEFNLANTPLNTSWGNFTIDAFNTAVGDVLNVTSVGFGTFSGKIMADTGSIKIGNSFFRNISATGIFTPGTNYPVGQRGPGYANFSVTLTKAGLTGLFSSAVSLDNRSTVPEPSSLLLAGLGVFGVAYQIRRRRRS